MADKVERTPVYINEVNKSKIDSCLSAGNLYGAFEAGIPLQLIHYREYEGRIKKLVYGKDTVSIRQLQYVLARDFDDFVDLVDPDSDISKIITSPVFDKNATGNGEEEEEKVDEVDADGHFEKQIEITRLLLFGLLYCKGTHEEKCERFWDIL